VAESVAVVGGPDGYAEVTKEKGRFGITSDAEDGLCSREQLVHLAIGILDALATEEELDMAGGTLGF
jgi:hypothetical protein